MHPILFSFNHINFFSYGAMILLGFIMSCYSFSKMSYNDLGIRPNQSMMLYVLLFIAGYIGAKLFFFMEDPAYYFFHLDRLTEKLSKGFVFYGTVVFGVPMCIWYSKKNQWPVWLVLDRIAIGSCIFHACGRLGCFLAGCCYGKPTTASWGVIFTNPTSFAPLQVALHPTQLYEFTLLMLILFILWILKKYRWFEGSIYLIYMMLYTVGRSIIEVFRGDHDRGFVIEGVISYAQFISFILIGLVILAWKYSSGSKQEI